MPYRPRKLLVTGGAGFIGCNFVRYCLQQGHVDHVVNLDALTYAGSLDNLQDLMGHPRHTFVQGDICDAPLVIQLLREHEIDTVVHFAAESHVDNSISGPAVFLQTNIQGTFVLLEACRKFWLQEQGWSDNQCRFHHISTDEVYGALAQDDPPFTEETPYAPNSPYSSTKAASDHLVRAWHHTYGLPVVTTNCSNNYGPYQHSEKFIPTVICSCLQGQPVPLYGDGGNIRDWLYVEDHCRGIDVVLRHASIGETYNIGGRNEWRNIDICKLICKLMDEFRPEGQPHAKLITFVKDRPGHDWRYAIDQRKIASDFGWSPQETFETGIRKTILWYLSRFNNADLTE
ncbi:MAG: dTDP-glucose 4,6-dehydratase [Gammaproteobacteria bacterium]|nr:MAG: dTDP-glucose 4,6-dehydratase [Gammaproteobacteria bacterium]